MGEERNENLAIRTSGRQKEKYMQVSYAKKMAVGQLQIKVRNAQECVLVLTEHSDCVYFG